MTRLPAFGGLAWLKPQVTDKAQRDYAAIFHTARGLAEIANVASTVPNYPELAELRASWAEMVEQRIADLMEAING